MCITCGEKKTVERVVAEVDDMKRGNEKETNFLEKNDLNAKKEELYDISLVSSPNKNDPESEMQQTLISNERYMLNSDRSDVIKKR
ncbi:hypothetical protein POVWA2_004510 [Plasmodium ovale wallikeri]|uniref:Uncharacterized protein n=2 Tax=Plasmodium ovale TaxID=36330 RepID=A0A1A8YHZ6_PLAOA|nr:hypothetical protein POVWA1_004380 [Plasmodium ovale wallikeri]SBT31500.1 hypothetical protein POVWA2_004510 [Plasmodium ovale wallikeri]SBT75384.1 hypothetical protein POWCR01_020018100 [Plasmodium ovale]